ncbi:MAG: 3'-5' exonuclease [Spirochaetota bacterium]
MEEFKYEVTQEEINALPIGAYEGPIHVIKSREEAVAAADKLLSCTVLGFDTESRPSFKKGEHYPIALMQISSEHDTYLFVLKRSGLPAPLRKVLSDDKITKIGLGLQQELNEMKQQGIQCSGFVDLEKIAARHKFKQRGIRALSAYFLKIRISKSAQKSNWARDDLSPAQIKYAATDSWTCLKIYQKMEEQGFLKLPEKEQDPAAEPNNR